ncbi:MAG: hypothetical protein GX173_14770 [Ruminococcaceae bacterium]|nr:hypothetical protein [Oscillospiraceae bacterium]
MHMISTQMMKLADANQWKVNTTDDMIFGEYNGYLFTILEGKRFKAVITPISGISPTALEQIMQYLDTQKQSLRLLNYDASDNFLCVRVKEGIFPISHNQMEMILGQLSGLFDLYEIPADACVICGETAQRRGLYMGLFCNLHKACEQEDMIDFTAVLRPETNGYEPGAPEGAGGTVETAQTAEDTVYAAESRPAVISGPVQEGPSEDEPPLAKEAPADKQAGGQP